MDEDEMELAIQSQLEAESEFGMMSYASFQVPAPTNIVGPNAKTAKAFQDAIMLDDDSSDEEEGDAVDDTSSPRYHGDSSTPRGARSQSTAVVMTGPREDSVASSPNNQSSFVASFRSASRSTTSRPPPLISSARAKAASNPPVPENLPPPLSLPPPPAEFDDEPPPSLSSVLISNTSSQDASKLFSDSAPNGDDEPPPRLPDLPALPVLRPISFSLRVDTSQRYAATSSPTTPLSLPSPLDIPPPMMGSTSAPTTPMSPTTPTSGSHARKMSASDSPRKTSSGTLRRTSLYNPANLPNGILQGELYFQIPQLPIPGWITCECSLVGTQLRWQCKDPQCYGLIELSLVTKVTRSKHGLDTLPAGSSSFSVATASELYYLASSTTETALLWRDAVEYVAPKKNKVKKQKKSPVSAAALATIKSRLGHLESAVSTATFNLLRLFFHGKYTFVKAIFSVIQVADADKVAGCLARLFFYAETPLQLVKSVIEWEVSRTSVVNQLFRQDSLASKIMTAYTRLIAQPYLVATLKAHVQKIARCGKELEINPDSLTPEERDLVGTRQFLLQSTITELLEGIRESVLLVPTECRLICHFLRESVSAKFNDPKATEIALAGYLFLRLINSAIVVPDSIGIIDKSQLSPDGRRSLLLVSKVILNMANQVEFNKEPYLIEFNPFLREKLPIIQSFIAECAEVPPDAVMTATNIPPAQMALDELAVLYRILHPLQDKLVSALADDPTIAKRMKTAFATIGSPPSPVSPTATAAPEGKDKDKKEKDKKHQVPLEKIPLPLPIELMHFASKSAQGTH